MAKVVGTGWQMIIADLSMILFMLTASAVTRQGPKANAASASPQAPQAPIQPGARSEPVAVWIAGEGAPPLREWLAQQPRDSRQQVTITASYAPGALDEALTDPAGLAFADDAGMDDGEFVATKTRDGRVFGHLQGQAARDLF